MRSSTSMPSARIVAITCARLSVHQRMRSSW
jgi:hypothetical protein